MPGFLKLGHFQAGVRLGVTRFSNPFALYILHMNVLLPGHISVNIYFMAAVVDCQPTLSIEGSDLSVYL